MDFVIERGNIVYCDTDAIVLPANKSLKEGSGTSRAIFSAAGRKQLTEACGQIGECEVGMAAPTSAYKLKSDYIIHAVVPRWIDGKHDEYGLLSSAYLAALNVADVMKCETISFPLLSAGNNGFSRDLAFKIAVESISSFNGEFIKEVRLIVFDEEMAVFVKTQGYEVKDLIKEAQNERKEKMERMKRKTKEVAKDALNAGLDFMKDKDNQKKIFQIGLKIATIYLESKVK